jgi:hypothetical protein
MRSAPDSTPICAPDSFGASGIALDSGGVLAIGIGAATDFFCAAKAAEGASPRTVEWYRMIIIRQDQGLHCRALLPLACRSTDSTVGSNYTGVLHDLCKVDRWRRHTWHRSRLYLLASRDAAGGRQDRSRRKQGGLSRSRYRGGCRRNRKRYRVGTRAGLMSTLEIRIEPVDAAYYCPPTGGWPEADWLKSSENASGPNPTNGAAADTTTSPP